MWTRRSNVGGCTYVQLKFSFYIQNNMLLFVEFLLLVASDVQKDAKLDDSVVWKTREEKNEYCRYPLSFFAAIAGDCHCFLR